MELLNGLDCTENDNLWLIKMTENKIYIIATLGRAPENV